MQMPWPRCNLPLPGDSNRVLVAVDLIGGNGAGGLLSVFVKELQSANAVYNVIRMVPTSGRTI